MKSIKHYFVIYLILFLALAGSIGETISNYQKTTVAAVSTDSFDQPPLGAGTYPWTIRSIDTQVVSKHWPKVTRAAIQEQIKLIADLGVNYIAIGTPYDRVDEMRIWAEEIHALGLNVWFRAHWAEWEGDEGKPATLSPEEYLDRTSQFIRNNPDLFVAGDAFTIAVEPEQVGVGLGKRFLTWDQYRSFLLSEITVANDAFESLGLKGKVYTNWLSVNGWIIENAFTQELVDKLGLLVIDHFVGQSNTIGNTNDTAQVIAQTMADLDRYHKQWNVPIFLGEWGYQIFQPVSDESQAVVIKQLFTELSTRPYLVGVNYWVHMGNTASIIGDEYGANLKYRPGAFTLKSFYDPIGAKEQDK